MPPQFVSTGNAALLLGSTRRTIQRHVAAGTIPAINVAREGTRPHYLIAMETIEAQLDNRNAGLPLGSTVAA